MTRRHSAQTLAVLQALASDPGRWRYGYELGQEVALKAGSLYPILIRMRERGLLDSSWESDPPAGRPPRHLYRLTEEGARAATQSAAESPASAERATPVAPGAGQPRFARRPARGSLPVVRTRGAW